MDSLHQVFPLSYQTEMKSYLNQPSDSLFRQNNLPVFKKLDLPTGALDYINSDPSEEIYVEGSLTYNGETIRPVME